MKQESFNTILKRARVLFIVLVFLMGSLTSFSIYAGAASGEITQKIIAPAKEILAKLKEIEKTITEEESAPNFTSENSIRSTTTVTDDVNIQINTNTNGSSRTFQYKSSGQATASPTTNYDQNQQSIDEWWAQMQKESAQKSAASQRQLEDFRKQSQEKLQQFDSQTQQGMLDFQAKYGNPSPFPSP